MRRKETPRGDGKIRQQAGAYKYWIRQAGSDADMARFHVVHLRFLAAESSISGGRARDKVTMYVPEMQGARCNGTIGPR